MSYRKVPPLNDSTKDGILQDLKILKLKHDLTRRAFGRALQDAATHGFTHSELAEEFGVSRATVTRWVRDAA